MRATTPLLIGALAALALIVGIHGASAASGGGGNLAPRGEPPIAAVWQPLNAQLEVLFVADDGSVRDTWKANNDAWNPPVDIAAPGSAPPHAHVSVVWQVQDEHLEAFWVGANGAVNLMWKEHNQPWHAPAAITPPGFSLSGAPLTSVWQPVRHELMVFGLGAAGQLNMVWKKDESNWMTSPMADAGFGVPGEQIASVYQPLREHIEVFAVSGQGAINDEWKSADGKWTNGPLTPNSTATGGGSLSAAWQPVDEHLEVFFVGPDGAYNTLWKQHDGPWQVFKEGPPGVAPGGAPISAAWQDLGAHLEVFTIGNDGAINDLWKQNDGAWNGPQVTAAAGSAVANGDIASVVQPSPTQLEVFYWDAKGQLWDLWKSGNQPWASPLRLTDPGGVSKFTQASCDDYWVNWFQGRIALDGQSVAECQAFAPKTCSAWRLSAPRLNLQTDATDVVVVLDQISQQKSDGEYLVPILDAQGDWTFASPHVDIYHGGFGTPGGPGNKESAGVVYQGAFNPNTGDIGFVLNTFKDGTAATIEQRAQYTGKITSLWRTPENRLQGDYQGTIVDQTHGGSLGSWSTPVTATGGFGTPIGIAYCLDENLTIPLKGGVTLTPAPPAHPNTNPPVANDPTGILSRPNQGGLAIATANGGLSPSPAGIPTTPSPAAGVSFNGQWVSTVQNGLVYVLALSQDSSGRVTGQYSAGSISNGVVVGHDLYADWTQGGSAGTLQFHMAPDNTTFAGIWTQGTAIPTPANAQGTWDAYNLSFYTKAQQQGDFTGAFSLALGAGAPEMLQFALSGSNAAGSYPEGTISGSVAHQQGRPTALAAIIAESSVTGGGTFYLYPDGSGFSGYWHGSDKSLAAWSGRAAPPPVAPLANAGKPPPAAAPQTPAPPPLAQSPAPVAPLPQRPAIVARLPQGQCPADTATVLSTGVNVRDGENGGLMPPPIAGGTLIQCLACDADWCLIADSNPHATVSRPYLEFTPPPPAVVDQAPQPPPQAAVQPAPPQPVLPPANFAGTWQLTRDKQWHARSSIEQDGAAATVTFTDGQNRSARMVGTINGAVFTFTWTEDGVDYGTGTFRLVNSTEFVGTTANTDGSSANWVGHKIVSIHPTASPPPPVTPAAPVPPDFGGCAGCTAPNGGLDVK